MKIMRFLTAVLATVALGAALPVAAQAASRRAHPYTTHSVDDSYDTLSSKTFCAGTPSIVQGAFIVYLNTGGTYNYKIIYTPTNGTETTYWPTGWHNVTVTANVQNSWGWYLTGVTSVTAMQLKISEVGGANRTFLIDQNLQSC